MQLKENNIMKIIGIVLVLLLSMSCAEKAQTQNISQKEAIVIARQAAIAKGYKMPKPEDVLTVSQLSSLARQA